MKVESVGEKPINKKKWVILFSVLGALIVGLIIAIVVVLIIRNNKPQDVTQSISQEYNEALTVYFDDNENIADAIVEQNLDSEGMLKLIKEKIDVAENEMVKAMLEEDYYMTLFSIYGADESKKDEILNGLIKVEEVLKTAEASEAVANIAFAYYDFDMYQKYVDITKERNPAFKSIYDVIEETEE